MLSESWRDFGRWRVKERAAMLCGCFVFQLVFHAILLDSLIINHLSPSWLSLHHACMLAHSLEVFVKASITITSAHLVYRISIQTNHNI